MCENEMSRKNLKKYESKRESKFSRNITTNPRRRRPASSPSASPLERASLKLGLAVSLEHDAFGALKVARVKGSPKTLHWRSTTLEFRAHA